MLCLELRVNEDPPYVAGIKNAIMLSAHVAGFIGAEEPATLRLAGMCDLGNDRDAHVYWFHELPLKPGDRVTFRLLESDEPTSHVELKPTDSPEYLEEQRQFHEAEAAFEPPTEPAERRWPNLRMRLSINGDPLVRAGYGIAEEHILCTLEWNAWRTERLRVFARSFAGAMARHERHQTEWLRANLKEGDIVTAEVDA